MSSSDPSNLDASNVDHTHYIEFTIALKEQSGDVDGPSIIRWTVSLSAWCLALLVCALEGIVAQASAVACGPSLRPIIRIAIDRYFLESFARLLIVIAFPCVYHPRASRA